MAVYQAITCTGTLSDVAGVPNCSGGVFEVIEISTLDPAMLDNYFGFDLEIFVGLVSTAIIIFILAYSVGRSSRLFSRT
ncbi:MAG: hypothetical protein OQK82_00020 [Candidatus Pacearchaeota archaeon]|nr:hypothetical protein [Candidatus Pacearchaeota archaeon]